MSLPGVVLNVSSGNLNLQPPSAEKALIVLGTCTLGTADVLAFYGDNSTLNTALDAGCAVEAASYALSLNGGPVGVMPLTPSVAGGISAVTHATVVSAATMTALLAPHKSILITITTAGALGTSYFTYKVGTGATSTPVVTPTGHTYLVPGTFCTVTFPTHNYAALETYTFATDGTITYAANGSGGSDASMTQVSSPVDDYVVTVTCTTAGALATSQFTYSLDSTTSNTSSAIVTTGGGKYALPNTGVYITFSGTLAVGDVYTFNCATASYSNSDLTAALAALETTYLSSPYALALVAGNLASASAWNTQCATLETGATTLFNNGVYVRFINGAPSVGTVTASGGATVIDSADTDSVLETSRLTVSAPHVSAAAGDVALTSPVSGLILRRNASWCVAGRASSIEASQNIGYVALGAIPGVVSIYRNEQTTPGLDAVGFDTMRTFPGSIASGTGLPGFFITDGHTMDSTTSDYYPLTNARVIDLGCTVARATALPLTNSKIPTTVRNGLTGVITERQAQIIEGVMTGALLTELVNTDPQDAVAVAVSVSRTHNILADGNLIIGVAIQPFAYARTITVNIGLTVSA